MKSKTLERLKELNNDILGPIRDRIELHNVDYRTITRILQELTPEDIEIIRSLTPEQKEEMKTEAELMEAELAYATRLMAILEESLENNI